ncbi:helveticin J family class III bacteriocin [Levilactobacillus paucivorans]|nr:helveticin J family class III bacteriocin [Levilactobacillus paucivorans]
MTITTHLLSDFEKTDLVPNNAMQNFVLDPAQSNIGYGIFVSKGKSQQEIVKYNFVEGGTSTPISMLTIKGYTDGDKTYLAGHCESMDVYDDNGETYLLITTKGSSDGSYGTQLTQVPVSLIDQNTTVSYHDLLRIGSMNNVGSKKSWGTPDRVEFSVDSAKANIVLWAFDADTRSHMALYAMSDIKSLFKAAGKSNTSEVSIASANYRNASDFDGNKKGKLFEVAKSKDIKVKCLLQGLVLTNNGNAYVTCESGIGSPEGPVIGIKKIWKFEVGSKSVGTAKAFANKYWASYSIDQGHAGDAGVELEGIHIVGGNIYMGVTYHPWDADSNAVGDARNRLYYFDKTLV